MNEALINQILDTGHGTGIDARTLKGVIHDEAAFARWAGEGADPVLDVIGPLFRGDLDTSQTALDRLSIDAGPNVQFRLHALGADILRDRGQFAEAVTRYELILADHAGTGREAVLRQHLGKVHFAAGNLQAARDAFAAALEHHRAQGADSDLIESSLIALRRADEEISRATQRTQDQAPVS